MGVARPAAHAGATVNRALSRASLLLCVAAGAAWLLNELPAVATGSSRGCLLIVVLQGPAGERYLHDWELERPRRPIKELYAWLGTGRTAPDYRFSFDAGEHEVAAGGGTTSFRFAVVGVPYWALMAFCGLLPAARLAGAVRRRRRGSRGRCVRCAYDLRGTPDRCPECGGTVAAHRAAPADTSS